MSSAFESLTRVLEPLVDKPLTQRVLREASGLRDRSIRLQEAALGLLHLPTTSDLAILERRVRSLTELVTQLESGLDRLEGNVRMKGAATRVPKSD